MEPRDLWRALFPRRTIAPDVDDEIRFHIEERIRERMEEGWSEAEARRDVLARFGDVERVRAACSRYAAQRVERRGWTMRMDGWKRDLRLTLRGLLRSPGFTTVVILTLALGIGATTAVFSALERVVLRPLPFPEPEELVVVWQNDRATGTVRENASTADYYDYLERNRTFRDLALHAEATAVFAPEASSPTQLAVSLVSRNLLDVLGRDVELGRAFLDIEDRPDGPAVVLLTHRFWVDGFGANPAVVGRSLVIDDVAHRVVGVLPADVEYPTGEADVWLPIRQSRAVATRPNHWVRVLGRLAEGATVAAAQEDMTRIMAELEVEYPGDNTNRGAFVEPLAEVGRADLGRTLWIVFGAVLVVLTISFVNVANLLLARGAARRRELAVLSAVGAGAEDLVRRFFVEGAVIALASGVSGVGLAWLGIDLLARLAPAELTTLGRPEINVAVLSFALAVSALVCLCFGLLPALQTRRLDVQSVLREGGGWSAGTGGVRLRRLLVSGQLALAVVLLLGATLLIGTVRNLRDIDPGFASDNRLRVDFALPDSRWPGMATYPNWPGIFALLESLEAEVEAVPGVSSASVVLNHPLDPGFTNSFSVEGRAYDPSQGEMTTRLVTPAYFETAGLSAVEGRLLTDRDRVDGPAVIVLNRSAADRYFPAGDAIGQRIAFWGPVYREVVGIVEDERMHGLTADVPPAMYISLFQSPPRPAKLTLLLRADVPPLTLTDGVRDAFGRVDPAIPVFNVATMEATVEEALARERFASTLLSIFAIVAVILAVIGVHGVLAYVVARRSHEVGVRMALGASRGAVVRMVLRQGLLMACLGIGVGMLAAAAVSGVLEGLLYGVSPTDPAAYLAVGASMGLAAVAATGLPALRAASVDPVRALRSE